MSNNRKERKIFTKELFNWFLRIYKEKTNQELADLLNISYSRIAAIKKIVEESENVPAYDEIFKKSGRKKIDKSDRFSKILDVFGNDNSLTQRGANEKLSLSLSKSQLSRDIKEAGLKRKRIRRRPLARKTKNNENLRTEFCSKVSTKRHRNILFLDESGFNLHTSINYGYSIANEDAVLFQPNSKGKNVSLCMMISIDGVKHFQLLEGAYNKDNLKGFLMEAKSRNVFTENDLLIMDNVRFHHSPEIKSFVNSIDVEILYLPPYSPDFNPIENAFGVLKQRLDQVRPRSITSDALKRSIAKVIDESNLTFHNFYRNFWSKINDTLNRNE